MITSELTTGSGKEENGEKKHFLISERVFMQIFSKSQAKRNLACDLAGLGEEIYKAHVRSVAKEQREMLDIGREAKSK